MSCPLARPIRELAGVLRPPQPLPPTPGAASSAAALFKQCSRLFPALAFRLCTHSMPPFFSLLCEAFLLSPRLSLCPFASKCNVSKGLVRWSLGSGLDCRQWNSRRKSLGNSRDFPEARLPLLGPPPYFEGWNWKEWVLYLVRCFLFNLER